jgi:hypothetical protein
MSTIKILQLAEDSYYVQPIDMYSNFGCASMPYQATTFADCITTIPPDVTRVFKDAKFITVEISWKIIPKEKDS